MKTGNLGILRCGLARDQILREYGVPETTKQWDRPVFEQRDYYGGLTVYFENALVAGYGLYFQSDAGIPPFLNLELPDHRQVPLLISELEKVLVDHKVRFQAFEYPALATEGGVIAYSAEAEVVSLVRPCQQTLFRDMVEEPELIEYLCRLNA